MTEHTEGRAEAADFELLTDFLAYMEAILGRSPLTCREYRYDLLLFFRYILATAGQAPSYLPTEELVAAADTQTVDLALVKSVRLSDCYRFLTWLTRVRGASAANRARKVASLRAFFRYLKEKKQLISVDPTYELETPKQDKRLPQHLNLEESVRLLDSVGRADGPYQSRDFCILTFFLNCGLRLAELCAIDLDDFRDNTLRVIGKGRRERTIYLNRACHHALQAWLDDRGAMHAKPEARQALFISRQGNRIAHSTVQRLIRNYILRAGLDPTRYSTHKLRHTAATLMYQHGEVDIRLLQQILGHASVATTEIYTHVDESGLHRAAAANPLASYEGSAGAEEA